MKAAFVLSLATCCMVTSALYEHVINKRVLPTNQNCDPDSEICRKGDWIDGSVAECRLAWSWNYLQCQAKFDVFYSWTVDVENDNRCKPVNGKRFKCGAEGTNTRCVCSDTKLPGFHTCRCQYWPPEDVGVDFPAFCTGYYTGGDTRVHHWACCNNCNDITANTCDARTWHGGSYSSYCGPCGQNTGGGRVKYYFNCGGCDKQQVCSKTCSAYDIPLVCWKWLDCFKGCCLKSTSQPQIKRDLSEFTFCGDGTCSDDENPVTCPADCCYQINSVNCSSNISKCTPECCHAPHCCLEDSDNNNKNSGSNKGVTVGIPVMVIVIIIVIVIVILAIVYYVQKNRSPRRSESTSNVLNPTVQYKNL